MAAGERYVVLGLAHARSAWSQELARWSTAAVVPVEFLKCLSPEEVHSRLDSGRPFSALVVDGGVPGTDRDLFEHAAGRGVAVVVVDDGAARRDWAALGVAAALPSDFDRGLLLGVLDAHAVPVGRAETLVDPHPPLPATGWRGRLLAVIGVGGAGTSTVAMALAQGMGADVRHAGLVLLADLALDADQALLHDAGDVVPGLSELADAYRHGRLAPADVRAMAYAVPDRGYDLLLGLRRHRDWAAVRPRAFDQALDGLRQAYKAVVADVTGDVEGEAQCGSMDVEERNQMARSVTARADLVLVVSGSGVRGTHRLVRLLGALTEHGVAAERLVPVVNRAPRNPRSRAEIVAAVAALARTRNRASTPLNPVVFVPERRRLEEALRDGTRVPAPLPALLAGAVDAVLDARGPVASPPAGAGDEPVLVAPGSLGRWSDDGDDSSNGRGAGA